MLKVKNLWFKYRTSEDWVLKNISFFINEPQLVLFMGKSGSGKSTLARILAGLIPFFYEGELKGEIRVLGHNLLIEGRKKLGGKVGFLGQNPELYTTAISVKREIISVLEYSVKDREELKERFNWVVNSLNLDKLLDKNISEISAGEVQKVEIATMLALKPKILILDEPLSRLDPPSKEMLVDLLMSLKKFGILIIVFEHNVDKILAASDRVFILRDGELTFSGPPRKIINFSRDIDLPEITEAFIMLEETRQSGLRVPITIEEALLLIGELYGNKY